MATRSPRDPPTLEPSSPSSPSILMFASVAASGSGSAQHGGTARAEDPALACAGGLLRSSSGLAPGLGSAKHQQPCWGTSSAPGHPGHAATWDAARGPHAASDRAPGHAGARLLPSKRPVEARTSVAGYRGLRLSRALESRNDA